jgi:hypothetical protein
MLARVLLLLLLLLLQDGDNPAAAGATGASAAELRAAASKLKSLGPPGTPSGATFKEQLGKQGKGSPAR